MARRVLVVLVACPPEAAPRLARRLVQDRLAACVNLLPRVASHYRWQGRVQADAETLLLIKTTAARYPALQDAIHQHHPYELPEVIAVPVTRGLPAYLDWVAASTRRTPRKSHR